MPNYEQQRDINASAEDLFAYLADVANLPKYFSSMTSAEPAEGEAVHVTATVDGRAVESEAWLRVDHARKHLDWGAEGPNNYHGRLDVTAHDGTSRVTVALHTDITDERIDRGLTATLSEIQRLVEQAHAQHHNTPA